MAWAGLCGPGALASVDASGLGVDENGDSYAFEAFGGDVPHVYFRLGLPAELCEYFGLEGVSAGALVKALRAEGLDELSASLGEGAWVALAVPRMGWGWAVCLVQMVLEDVLDAATHPGVAPVLDPQHRLIEGGRRRWWLFGRSCTISASTTL